MGQYDIIRYLEKNPKWYTTDDIMKALKIGEASIGTALSKIMKRKNCPLERKAKHKKVGNITCHYYIYKFKKI